MQSDKLITPKTKPQRPPWYTDIVGVITKTFGKNLHLLYSNGIFLKFPLTSAFAVPAKIGNMIKPYL